MKCIELNYLRRILKLLLWFSIVPGLPGCMLAPGTAGEAVQPRGDWMRAPRTSWTVSVRGQQERTLYAGVL